MKSVQDKLGSGHQGSSLASSVSTPEAEEAGIKHQIRSTRLDLLLELANHIESQINLGEARASLLLTAGGATAAAYVATAQTLDLWLRLSTAGRALLSLAVATLCIAIILALWAVRPAWAITRLGTRRLRALPQGQSVLTFASIAAQPPADYVASFCAKSDPDLEIDLLYTIHGKSLKAREKFTELFFSILFLIVSISLFALLMITLPF